MRSTLLFFMILGSLFACNETSNTVIPISNEDFKKEITDSVQFQIESNGGPITMKGNLSLLEGECTFSLKAPTGDSIQVIDTIFVNDTIYTIESITSTDTVFAIDSVFVADTILKIDTLPEYKFVYNSKFVAENDFKINGEFDREIGTWTFKYSIKKITTTLPLGSFDVTLKYED